MSIVVDGVMYHDYYFTFLLLFAKIPLWTFLIDNFRRSVDVDLVIIAACCFCAIDNLHIT